MYCERDNVSVNGRENICSGWGRYLRHIPEAMVLAALLCACNETQPPPTALTSDAKYTDLRILSDAEKRIIWRGASKGLKDAGSARFKWPQFPNTTDSPAVYCALINTKSDTGAPAGFKAYVILVTQTGRNITDASLDTTDYGPDGAADFCRRKGINLAESS
jgi:hypothetical protein